MTCPLLSIIIYIKSDSSFAPIRVENPVCRSAECRFSVKIHQPRLQIRRNGIANPPQRISNFIATRLPYPQPSVLFLAGLYGCIAISKYMWLEDKISRL